MKNKHYSIAAIVLLLFSTFASAEQCRVTQDAAELSNIREDAMMFGNYSDGWLFEKPDFDSEQGSLRCEPDGNFGALACVKKGGKTGLVTLSNARELVSGILIDNPGETRFLIDSKGNFSCDSVIDTIQQDKPNVLKGGVTFAFNPDNSNGKCQLTQIDTADTNINGNRLIEISGDSSYRWPSGSSNIPFQSLHPYPDELGISDMDTIMNFNQISGCDQLSIEITIEYCDYYTDEGRASAKCPAIEVLGEENFKEINIIRKDNEME